MSKISIRYICLCIMLLLQLPVLAQLSGRVYDAESGEAIAYPTIQYKQQRVRTTGDGNGRYSIARHNGWQLTVSAMGYKTKTINIKSTTSNVLDIKMREDTKMLREVEVKAKRGKYRKKENPAVALMKRVIAAKKNTKLTNHDFYQFRKYQKLMLAMNDIRQRDLDSGFFANKPLLQSQIERSAVNGKFIFPISVDETVSRHYYRKEPQAEKTIVEGRNSTGLNHLFQIGDIFSIGLRDIFCDVDIYDEQIKLLQYRFLSPIANSATSFYRYYIEDTIYVDREKCYHLQYLPNNQQDFGFRGELFVVADSTLHVKRCTMTIPRRSDVNFVDNLTIEQQFTKLDNDEWVLSVDDMIVELSIADFLSKALVVRNTRLNEYSFDEIPNKQFRGKGKERVALDAEYKDADYWATQRPVPLSKSEAGMNDFLKRLSEVKGYKWAMFFLKPLVENFIETGNEQHPSKVDIGPVNTTISNNFIDGMRLRASARTTANFHPHLYLSGYVARGTKSKKTYYKGEITWSFLRKKWMPLEFPKRTLTLSSTYDVMSPSDKFLPTDKDNVFTVLKWTKVNKMMFYNRQMLAFDWEERNGFRTFLSLRTEGTEAAGALFFRKLSEATPPSQDMITDDAISRQLHNGKMRNTELHLEFQYSPNRTYVHSKQKRKAINNDAPQFQIAHTMGIKGLLGGEYSYHLTEANIYHRIWLHSWGNIDTQWRAGAQWSRVPFPLLLQPHANLSYIVEEQMYNLVNNMEFLYDRYASIDTTWDLNGKLFNRIPLFHRLKWREVIGFKCLWGDLTDKNNPQLAAQNSQLMYFPEGSYPMIGHKPYVEVIVGVHNIFRILHVQYVRRLTYNDLPTAHKNGIRLMMRFSF